MSIENAEKDYLWDRRHNLLLRITANRIYQQERHRHMEIREGLVKVGSLVLGSVVFASVLDAATLKIAAAAAFALSAASLVFGWGNKARDASKRGVDWAALEHDVEAAGERSFSETQLDAWMARCNDIEASEPAPNQRMLKAARRRACEALGDKEEPAKRGWWLWLPPLFIP
jgi:hypothetical protein